MPQQPEHIWRIEAGVTGNRSAVYLNDEIFPNCRGATLEVSVDHVTRLTLQLIARNVQVITDPELHLIVGSHRFRVVPEDMYRDCRCGHGYDVHDALASRCGVSVTDEHDLRHFCTCQHYEGRGDLDAMHLFCERQRNDEAHQGL